jgi:hypothetical protein
MLQLGARDATMMKNIAQHTYKVSQQVIIMKNISWIHVMVCFMGNMNSICPWKICNISRIIQLKQKEKLSCLGKFLSQWKLITCTGKDSKV